MSEHDPEAATLRRLLVEAGWSTADLARHVNARQRDRIHPSTPRHWIRGTVPGPVLAERAADVLAEALGRRVVAGDIWPRYRPAAYATQPLDAQSHQADGDSILSGPWTWPALQSLGGELPWTPERERPALASLSTQQLLALTDRFAEAQAPRWAPGSTPAPHRELVDHIEATIPALRRLDDANGGAPHLLYVDAQLRSLLRLLRFRPVPDPTARRILTSMAHLGQLAGWMAFELDQQPAAQRYFALGLRAAATAQDRPLSAHILADLAYQAAALGQPVPAARLAAAAEHAAADLRGAAGAAVAGRAAFAHAVAGDDRAHETAQNVVQRLYAAPNPDRDPDWSYYLSEPHVSAQHGYSLVARARWARARGRPAQARALARAGITALEHRRPCQADPADTSRKAAYETAWLATAYALEGSWDQALATGHAAAALHRAMPSGRAATALGDLRADAARRSRNDYAASLAAALAPATILGP